MPEPHAEPASHSEPDTNPRPLAAAWQHLLNAAAVICLVALFYGASALAVTTFLESDVAPAQRASSKRQASQVLLCIGCGTIGAFAQARGLTPERLLISDVVVAALAGVIWDPRFRSSLSIYALAGAVGAVVASAALDNMWSAPASALIVALPFLITTFAVKERAATACDALLAALAGAMIGVTGAVLVLFVAGLSAVATGRMRKRPGSRRTLAAFTAALTLAAIFYNLSVGS